MEISIRIEAPELCTAIMSLAEAMKSRTTMTATVATSEPVVQAPPADVAPEAQPEVVSTARRTRRTKAEMEAARAAEAASAPAAQVQEAAQESASPTAPTASPSAPAPAGVKVPANLEELRSLAMSHVMDRSDATDPKRGEKEVAFLLNKLGASGKLSLLNPVQYAAFAQGLAAARKAV